MPKVSVSFSPIQIQLTISQADRKDRICDCSACVEISGDPEGGTVSYATWRSHRTQLKDVTRTAGGKRLISLYRQTRITQDSPSVDVSDALCALQGQNRDDTQAEGWRRVFFCEETPGESSQPFTFENETYVTAGITSGEITGADGTQTLSGVDNCPDVQYHASALSYGPVFSWNECNTPIGTDLPT